MAFIEKHPHFVLFPFMAPGHMIPMVDIAQLLGRRGVLVTILLTPLNSKRMKPLIDRAIATGFTIRVSLLTFPCIKVGLPEGTENLDQLRSNDDVIKFFSCAVMLKDQLNSLFKHLNPSCLISDNCFPWTSDLASDLHIPRFVFHGTCCFSEVVLDIVRTSKVVEAMGFGTDYFVVPNLPDHIQITPPQFRGSTNPFPPIWYENLRMIGEGETKAFGAVANTFVDLEPEYIEHYSKVKGKRVWSIGPVSLSNKDEVDKAERGNNPKIERHQCLKWLDAQKPGSVVYVCLGSVSHLASSQLIELGLGLEASNRPFIWVIRNANDELKAWLMEEKFEERVGPRGLVIEGWAPQVLILSHPSVGGFVTHCGWNSTLEGITAGVPMVTWPLFAEQFINEKFIVNVISIGVRVGVEMPISFREEEMSRVQVRSEEIKMAVDEAMDGGDEGEGRRERARKLKEMAERAVDEGGSSYINITKLIQVVMQENSEDQSANYATLD